MLVINFAILHVFPFFANWQVKIFKRNHQKDRLKTDKAFKRSNASKTSGKLFIHQLTEQLTYQR